MKKLLFYTALLVCFGFLLSCNQNKVDVPQKVIISFQKTFPQAKDVEWSMENETDFEAEFNSEGKEMSACFTQEGEWIETEMELDVDKLPKHIVAAFENNYAGFEIDESEWIETTDFKGYEIEIEKGDKKLKIFITESGEIVKIESKEDADEDDN